MKDLLNFVLFSIVCGITICLLVSDSSYHIGNILGFLMVIFDIYFLLNTKIGLALTKSYFKIYFEIEKALNVE